MRPVDGPWSLHVNLLMDPAEDGGNEKCRL
jgi:hypothetical protein